MNGASQIEIEIEMLMPSAAVIGMPLVAAVVYRARRIRRRWPQVSSLEVIR